VGYIVILFSLNMICSYFQTPFIIINDEVHGFNFFNLLIECDV